MRRTIVSYVKDQSAAEDRGWRIAVILAAGLERLLRSRQDRPNVTDGTVDFARDVAVTTDGQSEDAAEEG